MNYQEEKSGISLRIACLELGAGLSSQTSDYQVRFAKMLRRRGDAITSDGTTWRGRLMKASRPQKRAQIAM